MTEEIKLDLPGCNIPRYKYSFIPADIEALCRWCESQSHFFSNSPEVTNPHREETVLGPLIKTTQQILGLTSQATALRQALVDKRESDAAQHINQIRTTISNCIESLELPPADSIIGIELNKITTTQPELLLPALFAIHRQKTRAGSIQGNSPAFWRGIHLGSTLCLLEHGPVIDSKPAILAIEERVSLWQNDVTGLRRQAAEAISTLAKTRDNASVKAANFEEVHGKRIGDSEAAIGQLVSDAQTEISKFKDFVKSDIALKAPITYWETKALDHERYSFLFGAAVVLAMFLGAIGLTSYKTEILAAVSSSADKTNYAGILILFTVITLGFWFLRLVVRIFLSQQHLATDARERVAMVKTYMALREAGLAPKDGDLSLVLVALFRPTSDGMVKDEAMPPILAEALTRSSRPN